MSKKLFITGTGTDVGKTYVTGLIVKKLQDSGKSAAYYKAAMAVVVWAVIWSSRAICAEVRSP